MTTPSTTTRPIAVCQSGTAPVRTRAATAALRPMPLASASGKFDVRPSSRQQTPAARAVAATMASAGTPFSAGPRTAALAKRM